LGGLSGESTCGSPSSIPGVSKMVRISTGRREARATLAGSAEARQPATPDARERGAATSGASFGMDRNGGFLGHGKANLSNRWRRDLGRVFAVAVSPVDHVRVYGPQLRSMRVDGVRSGP
jgi:hypothetical protein